ncbi:hypothetical protein QFC22_002649 [Naganishia vaughanmartiniae]|uniref:Uncharacterized protein n=1 Tax=Naganishia vaughanmartiniae TaxID=1424756 RepID=A0ACC2XAA1_9TREE|nr:hypothetical protein QFC22_002649 [Naganishia vaughanmartiniae]
MKQIINAFTPAFAQPQEPSHARSTVTAQPEANIGIEEEDMPTNLVYEDAGEGAVDVTDAVLEMLERDNAFASSSKMLQYVDPSFLPLSSLADVNPTLPSSEVSMSAVKPNLPQAHVSLARLFVGTCSSAAAKGVPAAIKEGYLTPLCGLLPFAFTSGSTKTRADVNKSTRKLYRQKGTGKARVGSAGSGTRRGGGTIHGPHPRDFALSLPRKVQHLGLHVALSSKLQTGLLRIVKDYGEAAWTGTRAASLALSDETLAAFNARKDSSNGMLEETLEAAESTPSATEATVPSLEKFGPSGDLSITFVHGPAADITALERIDRCLRNIPGIDVLPVEDLAAYEVLRRKWTVLDVSAVEWLGARAGQAQLLEVEEGAEEADAEEVRLEEVPVSETSTSAATA